MEQHLLNLMEIIIHSYLDRSFLEIEQCAVGRHSSGLYCKTTLWTARSAKRIAFNELSWAKFFFTHCTFLLLYRKQSATGILATLEGTSIFGGRLTHLNSGYCKQMGLEKKVRRNSHSYSSTLDIHHSNNQHFHSWPELGPQLKKTRSFKRNLSGPTFFLPALNSRSVF